MRSSKSILAGVAAGALTLALVPMAASSAQAATASVTLGFPSMTVIQDATVKPAIPVTYKVDGLNSALTGVTLVNSITDKDGASVLGTSASTFLDDTTVNTQSSTGVSAFNLQNGAGAANFASIPAGTYTLSVTAVSTTTGVAVATSSMPFAVVTTAAAGTVGGSASFVSAQSLTATAVTSATVATSAAVSGSAPVYARFLNAAGGPIVGAPALVTAAATPTSGGSNTTAFGAATASGAAPGIYALPYAGADTWSTSPGSGSIKASFASPVNQIVGTLPVTLSASATMTDLAISSAVEGTASAGSTADDSTAIPAVNGVKFTVSGITKVGGVATAGVPVSFSVAGRNAADGADATAFSAISPATATSVTSGAGGTVSLEYTVSNPVNNTGARVTATFPGGSKTFYIQFQTPVVTAVEVPATDVSAANTGDVQLAALVVDQFGQPVAGLPVQAAVTGVAATTTPASLTTNAAGEVSYTIAVPAGTVAGATSALTFTTWGGSAFNGPTATINVTYISGSAAVAALTVTGSYNAAASSYSTLTGGKLNSATTPLFVNTQADLTAAYTPANDGTAWKIQAVATNASGSTVAGAPIAIKAADGGYVRNPSTGRWVPETIVYTNSSGVATAVLSATKTGDISYTVASGATSSTVSAVFHNRPTDARTVTVVSSATEVQAGNGATVVATVSDRFGNPVEGVSVVFTEVGPGFMAGTGTATTGAAGRAEGTLVTVAGLNGVSVVTATAAGTQTVTMPTVIPSSTDQVYASVANATLQTGNAVDKVSSYTIASPPVATALATVLGVTAGNQAAPVSIEVKAAGSRTITIEGSRTTVSGKPGIKIDGVVTGIEDGKTVVPYFRFPGQTTYSQGSARPTIEDSGFTWQRKTGKKFYAYVTNDDGAVQSNRIIIAAN